MLGPLRGVGAVERVGDFAVEVGAGVAVAAAGPPVETDLVVAVAGDGGGGGVGGAYPLVDSLAAESVRRFGVHRCCGRGKTL